MIVSVDGDVLVYRSGFAGETKLFRSTVDGVDYTASKKGEVKQALIDAGIEPSGIEVTRYVKPDPIGYVLHTVKLQLEKIQEHTQCGSMYVYLTGSNNFRLKRATFLPYKGNRLLPHKRQEFIEQGKYLYYLQDTKFHGQGRPFHYDVIKEYMEKRHGAIVVDNMEADDILAINQVKYGEDHIIASIDKDLQQVKGNFYNFVTEEITTVDTLTATLNLYKQVISGDMSDTIYGIKGMGPAKAMKALEGLNEEAILPAIEELYKGWFDRIKNDPKYKKSPQDDYLVEHYDPVDYMDEVHDLVRLLRTENEYEEMVAKMVRIGCIES